MDSSTYNGMAACSPCLAGKVCVQPSDCIINQCTAQKCAAVGWNLLSWYQSESRQTHCC